MPWAAPVMKITFPTNLLLPAIFDRCTHSTQLFRPREYPKVDRVQSSKVRCTLAAPFCDPGIPTLQRLLRGTRTTHVMLRVIGKNEVRGCCEARSKAYSRAMSTYIEQQTMEEEFGNASHRGVSQEGDPRLILSKVTAKPRLKQLHRKV